MMERTRPELSRRTLLGGATVAAAVGATGLFGAAPAHAKGRQGPKVINPDRPGNMQVALLGTGGGPAWQPGSERHGIATAVAVGDRYYLVDAGEGVGPQLRKAHLGNWTDIANGPLDALRAVFLTHLHSDHVSDLSNLFSLGLFNGIPAAELPIDLYGPGPRGALPPLFGDAPAPDVVSPESPTPGTEEMWNRLVQAFATDFNDRARDNRKPTPMSAVAAHDLRLPPELVVEPNANPHPPMRPFEVYEDDRVKVTATLVQHAPVFPAFGFRFDSDYGSVVISGDTGPSQNVVRLADGADVLLHEVIAKEWVDEFLPEPRDAAQEGLYRHLLAAHTTVEQCGQIATEAGVGMLVLHHMVPSAYPDHKFAHVRDHFAGPAIVGRDLMVINVG